MQNIIDEIRRYNKLKMITDDEIIPYIEMAESQIGKYAVEEASKTKAAAFYTLALLGQKLWLKIQQRANEYDESLDTFKDVKQEEYWMDKFYKLTTKKNTSGYFYAAV